MTADVLMPCQSSLRLLCLPKGMKITVYWHSSCISNTMVIFIIIDSIIAGITGTVLMTILVRLTGAIGGYRFSVPAILGRLLTFKMNMQGQSPRQLFIFLTGAAVHYSIGILFALLYAWLVSIRALQPQYSDGLLFGAAAGLTGVTVWYLTLKLHPLPPALPLPFFLSAVFAGHLVFGVSIVAVFKQLSTFFIP